MTAPRAAATEGTSALDVFRNRSFLLLWLAQASTQIGGNMVIFGLTVIISKATGSTTAVSALILTFLVPAVLFSAVAGVFSASMANGGSLNNIGPGIDFFAQLKSAGNFIPIQATPQTIASGQTPVTIDWDYLNLAYGKNFPAARIRTSVPSDGVPRR